MTEGSGLSKKLKLNDDEKKKIRKRWLEEPSLNYWQSVFEAVVASPFCLGRTDLQFRAHMMWCFQSHPRSGSLVHTRLMEGLYSDVGGGQEQEGDYQWPPS